MKEYQYDIAISLCKEDVGFARKLVKELNPKLNVFFYEDRQKELIGKIGPEEFAGIFRDKSRVVVVLYREIWGDSYFTELERDAIISRTAKPDEGQGFIFMLPLERGKVPSWYPPSRIYASPFNFSIVQLAQFLEFKVTERDGIVEPMTFEENLQRFEKKLNIREEQLRYLQSRDSVPAANIELDKFIKFYNGRIDSIQNASIPVELAIGRLDRSEVSNETEGFLRMGLHRLKIFVNENRKHNGLVNSSQEITIRFNLSSRPPHTAIWDEGVTGTYRFNNDGSSFNGWSEVKVLDTKEYGRLLPYLFYDSGLVYNLSIILTTEQLVTMWLNRLLKSTEKEYRSVL